jgi:Ser/Thr protein kinase RdoA (MazF antagonist)
VTGNVQPPGAVIELLGRPRAHATSLDPRGHPWLLEDDDAWRAVLRRSRPRADELEASLEHVAWLHRFLDRLAPVTRVGAPKPLPALAGDSVAVIDGELWELLAYVPGRALLWDPAVPVESAGAALARFHQASILVSPAEQRPLALPMEACHPLTLPAIAERFQRRLADSGHTDTPTCVLHGDATVSNMLVDEHVPEVSGLIDFALAHLGPPESDISFALWVAGRTHQPATVLDAQRVQAFVAGYHRVRPLTASAISMIPLYLVGRGLQMLVRLERAGARDEIQLSRIVWLDEHQAWLQDVVAAALE